MVESLDAERFLTLNGGRNTVILRAPGRLQMHSGEDVGIALDHDYVFAFDREDGNAFIDRSE